MAGFIATVAEMVGAEVVQEAVSGAISLVLGKRKEKASQGHFLERLTKAVHEVEFVLERTAKLPITEVSLLREKIELKREFIKAAACLPSSRRKKRQGQQQISQVVTHSSSSPQGLAAPPGIFAVSSFIAATKDELFLSCDNIERFEQFAESARNILTRIESGCSLRQWMNFSSPLVRHLFEWRTLFYKMVHADKERYFEVWPARLEGERGVEAVVRYLYSDRRRPDKAFYLGLVLRLSEATDIVGIVIKCLQSLASDFSLMANSAMAELTLLPSLLQDVSHSHASAWVGIQEWHSEFTQEFRPDPLCCYAAGPSGGGPCCANKVVSSGLSHIFPVEVILFHFECHISAPEYNLRSSTIARRKTSVLRHVKRPHLQLTVFLAPHYVCDEQQRTSYAYEKIGDNEEEHVDVTIQQVGETVRPKAINCFLCQPKETEYLIGWVTKHGAAWFNVQKKWQGVIDPAKRRAS